MEEIRRQALLDMLKKEPRSIQDIADMTGVHYVTAHKWIKELAGAGLITKMPFGRGKRDLWTVHNKALEAREEGLIVQAGNGIYTVAQMTVPQQGKIDPYTHAAACLAYLYRRSLLWDNKDVERGMWEPVNIKARVRQCRQMLLEELSVVEQLLLIDEIWEDSSKSPHVKMGTMDASSLAYLDQYAQPILDAIHAEIKKPKVQS